jgi:hypothetical protein
MKRYITSDKVGEFVQSLFAAGLKVQVDGDSIAVHHSDHSFTFVEIYEKGTLEKLITDIIENERYVQEQKAFDDMHQVE